MASKRNATEVSAAVHETREQWLDAAAKELGALCKQKGSFSVPAVRVSVGFPKGRAAAIGQYWQLECTTDKQGQVFIHPTLDDAGVVLATLLHELIHASDNGDSKHKGDFIVRARAVGLEKPWTATTAGADLQVELTSLLEELGPYPHAKLTPGVKIKKQTTRMIKVTCPLYEHEEPYLIRMTRKQIDTVGTPICPQHGEAMIADTEKETEDA
jgi:hypothetical protein